jgi:hypothetical protein
MNKQMKIRLLAWDVDRQMFIMGIFAGAGFFFMFRRSVLVGVTAFVLCAIMAWIHAKDPVRLKVMFNGPYKKRYDALKRK